MGARNSREEIILHEGIGGSVDTERSRAIIVGPAGRVTVVIEHAEDRGDGLVLAWTATLAQQWRRGVWVGGVRLDLRSENTGPDLSTVVAVEYDPPAIVVPLRLRNCLEV